MCSQEAEPGYLAPFSSSAGRISSLDLDAEIVDEIGRHELSLHIT